MTTLLLKEDKKITYYLSSITAAQKDLLYKAKAIDNTNNNTKELRKLTTLWGINCEGISKIGSTKKDETGGLTSVIGFFLGKDTAGIGMVGYNREVHYRNYSMDELAQREKAWIINYYQDTSASAKSAFTQMDEEYCCLWEIDNKTPMAKEFITLLGKKRWKISH